MKKLFFALLLSLPIFLTAGQYAGFHAGTDYRNKTDCSNSGQKVGVRAGLVYGYDFGNGLRSEAELSYREGAKRTQYVDSNEDQVAYKRYDSHHEWSYIGNFFYDLNQLTTYSLTPFVGVGAGYVQTVEHLKIKSVNWTHSEKRRDSGFAYQGMAGLSYPIAEGIRSNVTYCYHVANPHAKNHSVTVGFAKIF